MNPWEVKKEPGTKLVRKSADLNYNNYLLHFSHVCNVRKPHFLMKTGTQNHQKSMPGACLRKTPKEIAFFYEKCPTRAPAGTLKSSKIDANCLEVLTQPTFLGTRVQSVQRGGLAPKMLPTCSKCNIKAITRKCIKITTNT